MNASYGPTAEESEWAARVAAARAAAAPSEEFYLEEQHIDPQYDELANRILALTAATEAAARGGPRL